jgi:pilus assembly protein CpaC
VELGDGQSFAIAGLLDNVSQNDSSSIPFLSSIPIIGNLFKSKAKRSEQTELLVLITPRLVRPLDPDEVPALPTNQDDFIKNPVVTAKPGDLGGHIQGGAGLVDAPPQSLKRQPVEKQ